MNLNHILLGNDFPENMPVVIEIPMHHDPVKYEMDKMSGSLFVDRFMQTAMHYPCNYGFVPHTISGDGDPSDVLVVTSYPIIGGAVVISRPIGILLMEDEAGLDEKIIALPTQKIAPEFAHITDIQTLDPLLKKRISHFFSHYKDLEANKWVKVVGFEGQEKALTLLKESAQRVKK